jgi:hypothetical protein
VSGPDWRRWPGRMILSWHPTEDATWADDHWVDADGHHWWVAMVGDVAVTYELTEDEK